MHNTLCIKIIYLRCSYWSKVYSHFKKLTIISQDLTSDFLMEISRLLHVHFYISLCRFGPLINHWTTRFEAKHKYFKHLSNTMGNFKNICYSLAIRHQLYQCYVSLNSETIEAEDVEIGPGKY